MPHRPPELSSARTLRIASFNVHGLYLASRDRAPRMRAIGRLLRESGAELVALQEAFIERDRCMLLEELRGSELRHHAYYASGLVGSGLLVLSKGAIAARAFRRFAHSGRPWKPWQGDWYAGKGVAHARVELEGGGALDLFDTHAVAAYGPGRDENHPDRCAQMVELVDFVHEHGAPGRPALVAGDLNARRHEAPLRIATGLGDLEHLAGDPDGIDHVLAPRDATLRYETVEHELVHPTTRIGARCVALSDHPLVLATLRVVIARRPIHREATHADRLRTPHARVAARDLDRALVGARGAAAAASRG